MEHQDKIFEQFKKAAENQDSQDFPGIEKVWSRVDAKLDTQVFKAQKKNNTTWKKFAVAASVAITSLIVYQFVKEDKNITLPEQNNQVVTIDTVSNAVKSEEIIAEKDSSSSVLIDKKEAVAILKNQINKQNQVVSTVNGYNLKISKSDSIEIANRAFLQMQDEKKAMLRRKISFEPEVAIVEKQEADIAKGVVYETVGVKHAKQDEIIGNHKPQESEKKKQVFKKAPPLVVVDGKATDKKVSDIENADDLETIVELKEPLYIINGKEYSEKELFGPNPTSPYYPLNNQEIESMSIYQDEEAIELYGDKGKKGVVVIKTKYGRPAIQKK